MKLAFKSGISPRHMSFVETGRATPSRDVILRLGAALELSLRGRNDLLLAAGYAPVYPDRQLSQPELSEVNRAARFLLDRHEPFSAVVLDRSWNILMGNDAHHRLLSLLVKGDPGSHVTGNLMRLLLHPNGARASVVNWTLVSALMYRRLRQEALALDAPTSLRDLAEEAGTYPGIPGEPDPNRDQLGVLMPVQLLVGREQVEVFTTVTSLIGPLDVTLEELRIETYFPADEHSRAVLETLGVSRG